jgi:hypothetical protein
MPLERRKQVAIATESVPGTAATIAGAAVIDTLEANATLSQGLIDRQPSGGTLSKGVEAVGRRSGEVTFDVDIKGSGTAGTEPNYWKAIRSAYYANGSVVTITLAAPGLTEPLPPGDRISTSGGAAGVVLVEALAGATTIICALVAGTFGTSQQVNSALKGNAVGTTASSSPQASAGGLVLRPTSFAETTVDTTGDWDNGDPDVGEGVQIKDGETVVGEAIYRGEASATSKRLEMAWGILPAGGELVSISGSGATAATLADPTNAATLPASLTAQLNRAGHTWLLAGGQSTFTAQADAGQPGRFSFTVTGQVGDPFMSEQLSSGVVVPSTTPPKFGKAVATINGVPLPVKSFQFDAGVTVSQRADANLANGEAGGQVTERAATLQVTVEQTALETVALWNRYGTGDTVRVGIQVGTAAGNRISFVAERAQISDMTPGEAEGLATFDITFQCRAVSGTGDDEVYIAHT